MLQKAHGRQFILSGLIWHSCLMVLFWWSFVHTLKGSLQINTSVIVAQPANFHIWLSGLRFPVFIFMFVVFGPPGEAPWLLWGPHLLWTIKGILRINGVSCSRVQKHRSRTAWPTLLPLWEPLNSQKNVFVHGKPKLCECCNMMFYQMNPAELLGFILMSSRNV